jgi:hypothetical protein
LIFEGNDPASNTMPIGKFKNRKAFISLFAAG